MPLLTDFHLPHMVLSSSRLSSFTSKKSSKDTYLHAYMPLSYRHDLDGELIIVISITTLARLYSLYSLPSHTFVMVEHPRMWRTLISWYCLQCSCPDFQKSFLHHANQNINDSTGTEELFHAWVLHSQSWATARPFHHSQHLGMSSSCILTRPSLWHAASPRNRASTTEEIWRISMHCLRLCAWARSDQLQTWSATPVFIDVGSDLVHRLPHLPLLLLST